MNSYVSEDQQHDQSSEDSLDEFEEDVHWVSDLAKQSTIGDQVNLIEE